MYEEELDREVYEVAWDFMAREERMLRGLCYKMCRGRRDKLEELWDIVVDRLPGIVVTYDPRRSSFKTHAYGNLRWYMWKHMNNGARYAGTHRSLGEDEHSYQEAPNIDITDEVQSILSKLDPYDRAIISLYTLCDLTFEEISSILEVSYGTARAHYRKAIERARCLLCSVRDDAAS